MPFRSKTVLESWLDEFRQMGYPVAGEVKVIEQDGEDGGDTGLVAVRLARATTVVYMQPEMDGSYEWLVTMEPRETPVVLNSAAVLNLAAELTTVSALCAFLQVKSQAYVAQHEAQKPSA